MLSPQIQFLVTDQNAYESCIWGLQVPKLQQAVNPLLNGVWIQTMYHFKAKDTNYLKYWIDFA